MAVARLAGRLSRLAGEAAERPFPGRSSPRRPGAVELAGRLPLGRRSSRRRTARRRPPRWSRRCSCPRIRLAHNGSGANLVSGVASRCSRPTGPTSGSSRSTRARFRTSPGAIRPQAVCLGNLFRDQLDRYGELERIAERWREAVAGLPAGRGSSSTPTTHRWATGAPPRRSARVRIDDPARRGRLYSTPPTRSTACAAGRPTNMQRPTSAISETTGARACHHGRPPLDVSARAIELPGSRAARSTCVTPEGTRRGQARPPRALQRLQRPCRRCPRARAGREPGRDRGRGSAGARAAFGRFERIRSATGPCSCS